MRTVQEWRAAFVADNVPINHLTLGVLRDMEALEQIVEALGVAQSPTGDARTALTLYAEWVTASAALEDEIRRLAMHHPRLAGLVDEAWGTLDKCIDHIPLTYD